MDLPEKHAPERESQMNYSQKRTGAQTLLAHKAITESFAMILAVTNFNYDEEGGRH